MYTSFKTVICISKYEHFVEGCTVRGDIPHNLAHALYSKSTKRRVRKIILPRASEDAVVRSFYIRLFDIPSNWQILFVKRDVYCVLISLCTTNLPPLPYTRCNMQDYKRTFLFVFFFF